MDADPWADVPSPSKTATPTKRRTPSPSPPDGVDATDLPTSPDSPPAKDAELELTTPSSPHVEMSSDTFDDFDEFDDDPRAGPSQTVDDDDAFGDFDDFQEGGFEDTAEQPEPEPEPMPIAGPSWHALRLRPMPAKGELLQQLTDLLEPTSSDALTDEPPRQVGGLGQVMVSDSSREAYAQLTTPPMLKTLDWTRSRTRREHLISMGVPVNLDEVDSHRLSSLPPLRITTGAALVNKRSSTNSYPGAQDKGKQRESFGQSRGSQSVPASAGPNGSQRPREKYGLGSKPLLDVTKAEDLCGLEEDRLSLLSLDRLKAMQEELVQTSAAASALLAWSLQYKDAQVQDSTTYNGMISELIANAAKAKSAQATGSGGVFKRASVRRPQSSSPSISPRVGSPAMR